MNEWRFRHPSDAEENVECHHQQCENDQEVGRSLPSRGGAALNAHSLPDILIARRIIIPGLIRESLILDAVSREEHGGRHLSFSRQ